MSRLRSRVLRSSVLALVGLVAGCVVIPIPTPQTPPRFTADQIDQIGRDTLNRDAVRAKLGVPDIRAASDQVWIYNWTVTSGELHVVVFALGAGTMGPITSETAVLVLTFDKGGALLTKELAREVTDDGMEDRYCTARGLCVDLYKVVIAYPSRSAGHSAIANQISAVTAKGKLEDLVARLEPRSDRCLVVMWPDAPPAMRHSAPSGLLVNVAKGQYYSWLPAGAFVEMVLWPGTHTVEAWAESGQGSATFECGVGERIYLAIGAVASGRNQSSVVIKRIDPTAALSLTESMARVLQVAPTDVDPVESIPKRRDLRGKPY